MMQPIHSHVPFKVAVLLAAATWHATLSGAARSQELSVDRLFPPAVTVGQETTIKLEGKLPAWPVKVHCDRADVQLQPAEESGGLTVTVPAEATAGIAWLRFYDDNSASALVPLLVESVAVTAETEPNNEVAQATRADLPAVIVGRLEKSNDVDCIAVSVSAGQTLVADVLAHRLLGSPMDAVLQLVDLSGNVLAQADDSRGIDPQLVYHCEHDAELALRLFAFPETANSTIGFAGAASFVYRIQVTTGPLVDHSLPLLAPADAQVDAQVFGWNLPEDAVPVVAAATEVSPPVVTLTGALGWHARASSDMPAAPAMVRAAAGEVTPVMQLPAIVSGHIAHPREITRLQVAVEAGAKYRVAVHSQASGLKLDSVITVIDPENGKQLGRNDDASRNDRDAAIEFTAPGDKPVEIQISDLVGGAGLSHAYSALISKVTPAVTLSAGDRHRLSAGNTLEVAVQIQRQHGFDQPLQIVAIDLPEGVSCEPALSEPKGDSAKEVKLKLSADAAARHQGPIRIIARAPASGDESEASGDAAAAADEPAAAIIATAQTSPRPGFSTRQLWLSVAP
jgi:hypothetical protein